MATTTTNLGLTKPALSESADVGVINDNSDKIDAEAGKSRANLAATYSASSAYAVGAYCERGGNLYRCTTAIGSGGEAWNAGHWTQVKVTTEIPKVIDNLTSTSASAALSAKQGKVLGDKVTGFDNVMGNDVNLTRTASINHIINFPNTSRHLVIVTGNASVERFWLGYIYVTSAGNIRMHEIDKGTYATASIPENTTNQLQITFDSEQTAQIRIINILGNAAS